MSLNPLEEDAKIGLELKEIYLKDDTERERERSRERECWDGKAGLKVWMERGRKQKWVGRTSKGRAVLRKSQLP